MSDRGIGSTISGGARRLVPGFIRDRYLAKFVVIMLLVVVVIAAVGAVGYVEARDTVEQSTEEELQATAALQADSIGKWADTKKRQARMVSRADQVQTGDPDEVNRYFNRNWRQLDVRAIHYVNLEDETVDASTIGAAEGRSLDDIDDPWADASAYEGVDGDNDVVVGERAYEESLTGDDIVTFASPVYGWNDRVIVIVAGIENHVETLYQPSTGQSTTIVDQNGDPVLSGAGGNSEAHQAAFDEEDNVTNGTVTEGEENVYAYAPVEGTNWIAVTSVPTSQAYAVSDTVVESVGAIVGISLIALVGAAIVLGRHTATPLTRLRSRVKQMEEGDLEVDLETRRSDEIGQLYGGFATMRDSLRERIDEVQEARAEAEEARDEAERMNDHLETKADEYNAVIDDWAEGDLTRRLDPESENAAMTEIAVDLNEMVSDLEVALDNVKQFANQTAVASEQVTASTEEVRTASQQVTGSIQEISEGAERQNESLLSAAEEMNNLSATTEEISSQSLQVATLAERTAKTGREGSEAAQEAIEAMEEIEAESEEAVAAIRELEREEVAQIDELIASIADIAKETNMLALNANIEASRSAHGDEREGFGVVANEIKELSQDAREAADEIETRLEAIREQTEYSANEVEQTSDLIDDASDRVEKAVDDLEEIAEYAEETNTGVQEIRSVTEEQASSTEEVVTQVEEVTTISEETAAEAETVASAAEEQTAALTETSQSVEDLSRRASRLSDALDRFETEIEDDRETGDELEVL